MLERDEVYQQRCLAYEFFHHLRELKLAQQFDPDSGPGKEIRGKLKNEEWVEFFNIPGRDIAAEIKAAQENVDSPRYEAIKAEHQREKVTKWYSMWNGPSNVEALARHLGRQGLYEIFYRYWSRVGHGEGAIRRLGVGSANQMLQMDPIRSPAGLPQACRMACSLANEMINFLVEKYLKHFKEEVAERYRIKIKPGLLFIDSVKGLEGR